MGKFIPSLETKFHRSHRVSNEEVRETGALTLLPVYRNLASDRINRSAAQQTKEWSEIIDGSTENAFYGPLNTISGAWDALILPEAHPDRLDLTAWFTNFFFLIDDKAEALPRNEAHDKLNVGIANILFDAGKSEPNNAFGNLLVPQVRKVLACDYDRGLPYLRALGEWVLTVETRGVDDITNFDDYFEFRVLNSGMMPYSYAIEYTMELNITDSERHSVLAFRSLVAGLLGLSNDWWTWPKECAAMASTKSRLTNAVTILIQQYKLPTYKALKLLKKIIFEKQQELIDMHHELTSSGNKSEDFQRYIDAHLWMVSGNSLWETTCPRYHKELHFILPM